jgi:hypothetical protein
VRAGMKFFFTSPRCATRDTRVVAQPPEPGPPGEAPGGLLFSSLLVALRHPHSELFTRAPPVISNPNRVSEKPRGVASPGFLYFPWPYRDLRRVWLGGGTLCFWREHAGSDREPHVHDRLPKISASNSPPLQLESPFWLALLSRSHPERESRTSRRAVRAGRKSRKPARWQDTRTACGRWPGAPTASVSPRSLPPGPSGCGT